MTPFERLEQTAHHYGYKILASENETLLFSKDRLLVVIKEDEPETFEPEPGADLARLPRELQDAFSQYVLTKPADRLRVLPSEDLDRQGKPKPRVFVFNQETGRSAYLANQGLYSVAYWDPGDGSRVTEELHLHRGEVERLSQPQDKDPLFLAGTNKHGKTISISLAHIWRIREL